MGLRTTLVASSPCLVAACSNLSLLGAVRTSLRLQNRPDGLRLRPLAGCFAIAGVTYSASVADPTDTLPFRAAFAIERGHLRLGVSRAGYLFGWHRTLDARQILFGQG